MGARQTCPDCKVELHTIRLIDATIRGTFSAGSAHIDLEYAAPDAKPGLFTGTVPSEGIVWGKICPECGRILLYGEPFR